MNFYDGRGTMDEGRKLQAVVRRLSSFILLIILSLSSNSYAAEKKSEIPAVPAVAPAPAVESEKAKGWKGLQAQEQWVARLKKQIAGETKQLSDMRAQFAEKFKLDPKKLDVGAYSYDEKKDAFVDSSAS